MKVLLSGASGFVGREVLRQLVTDGHSVRVLTRDPHHCEALRKEFSVEIFHGNLLHRPTLDGCMAEVDAVVHLVGIIAEEGENTYERVHVTGTQNLLAEAKKAKVKRFVHMSAIGAREGARSAYHQTKWAAEETVRASGLDWTIFRPSIIYGPGDAFVNLFAKMTRCPYSIFQFFTLPLIGSGYAHLQPISVDDVARSFSRSLTKPESVKKIYDLCGPAPLRLRDILRTIAEVEGHEVVELEPPFKCCLGDWSNLFLPLCLLKGLFIQPKILLVPVPIEISTVVAWLMNVFMSRPLLNRDQILMLEEDSVGDSAEAVKDFGLSLVEFRAGISVWLGKE